MSIRSLARSIARARMQHAGVEQMNKKRFTDNSASGKRIKGLRSYFAMNWRKYLDPTTQEYKWGTRNVTFRKKKARSQTGSRLNAFLRRFLRGGC